MTKITLGAIAILMGGCAQAPFTPAPKIAPLNFTPVKQGNVAISSGNKKIGQLAQSTQTKLEQTRDSLDAAIVAAQQLKEDNAQIDAALQSAKRFLSDAITENTNLRMATYTQQQTIDAQTQTIQTLSDDGEAKQKQIDSQTAELTTQRQANANYAAQEKLDKRWWGLGYFLHGAKVLGWHLLIVAVILAVAGFFLNMFVPVLQPVFTKIVAFFVSIPGAIGRFIVGLFKKRPPS